MSPVWERGLTENLSNLIALLVNKVRFKCVIDGEGLSVGESCLAV